MELTICTLKKEGLGLIVHGMIHAAPDSFYKKIQREINDMNNAGWKIFYEGVRKSEGLDGNESQQEKDIAEYFKFMAGIIPDIVAAWGLSSQDKIEYPDNAINADISFKEMVKKLAENGFADDKGMKKLLEKLRDENSAIK